MFWIWLAFLPCLFFTGMLYGKFFSKQSWWVYVVYSFILGVCTSFLFVKNFLFLILVSIIHPIIIYRGIMYIGRPWNKLISIPFLWIGGSSIYFISFFSFRYMENLHPYLHLLTVCGIFMLMTTMFITNTDHLRSSTLSKEEKPFISPNIKNQNRVFLILTIGLIFLIANGKMIKDGFWHIIRSSIQWLINLGSSDDIGEITEESPPPANLSPPFLLEDEQETSVIIRFFEMILIYAMYVLIIVGVIIIILLMIQKTRNLILQIVKNLIRFLKQQIGSHLNKDEETVRYIDEKENIFDWQDWKGKQQERVKTIMQKLFKRKPSWDSLSNDEKVRFIYKHFISNNLTENYHVSQTPREIIEQIQSSITTGDELLLTKLRDAYEHVRYGEKHIDHMVIEEIYALIQEK